MEVKLYVGNLSYQTTEDQLRDLFGHQRLREGKYTAGQIDAEPPREFPADSGQQLFDDMSSHT